MVSRGHCNSQFNVLCADEVCCGCLIGAGSSANENVSPLVCFAIGGFLGLPGRAAIENEFIFGGVAQIYRHHDSIEVVASFLSSWVRGSPKLTGGVYPMLRTCAVVAEYCAQNFRGFCEDFGG